MKKFLMACLCVLVGLFSFAGCNADDSNKKPTNDDSGWTDFH